jgi:hypothetical protein
MGMALDSSDLLPGEAVVLRKNANAVIALADYGLTPFSGGIGKAMELIGMAGAEAIGGRLYLTNYRLLFMAHGLNRVRGASSLYLPHIQEIRNSSSGLIRRVTIVTTTHQAVFVVWGVAALINAVNRARAELDPTTIAWLEDLSSSHATNDAASDQPTSD